MTRFARFILPMLVAAASGCETIPDHCEGYKLACLNVTVDNGPTDVHRLRVNVTQGIDISTVLTPKKASSTPLVYPLRFAIRFAQFPDVFDGMISFDTIALNEDFDTIGQTTTQIAINYNEKSSVHISLGEPPVMPDMSSPPPDLSGRDFSMPDLSPEMPDLTSTPDMP